MLNRILAALALAAALLCASIPARAATIAGLQPDFAIRLVALERAIPGITIMSGYRSSGVQAALYARARHRYGRGAAWMVARPGRSMHNLGLAADLHFPSLAARAAAHRLAGSFGLTFRMGYEPWHIEPIGALAIARGGFPTPALAYAPISPLAAAAAAVPWPVRGVVHLVTYRHHHHRHHAHRHHGRRR